MNTIYLVDGTYELFRAHYGAPPRRNPEGQEVGATAGLVRSLLALIRDQRVTHIACAFDHVIESFRNDLFAGYKNSEGVDPVILAQFTLAEQAASALGIVVWPMIHYETDDALATAASRWKEDPQVDQIRICSPDKDFAQCVSGERVVCLNRRSDSLLDEEGVLRRFGVRPSSIPDWLALVGDSADGIPGIPGWGKKTASTVLRYYRHLEQIPPDCLVWEVPVRGSERVCSSLRERMQEALLYRDLATLRTDVELKEDLSDLKWQGVRRKDLEDLCERLGDNSLLKAALRLRPGGL